MIVVAEAGRVRIPELLAGTAVGLVSGYVGTQVMDPVSTKLYELEPPEARRQEDDVRPGSPYEIAAKKTAGLLGLRLRKEQLSLLGSGFHYATGMSWGAVYLALQRATRWHPVLAGVATGTAMWAIVDEGMTPALGLSAPNERYPLVTHVRALVAHLGFGLAVAATAEAMVWIGRRTPRA